MNSYEATISLGCFVYFIQINFKVINYEIYNNLIYIPLFLTDAIKDMLLDMLILKYVSEKSNI